MSHDTPDPADIARSNAREVLRHACALYVALELSEMIPAAAGHPATDDLRELAARLESEMNFLSPRHVLRKGDLDRMRTLSALAQKPEAQRLVDTFDDRLCAFAEEWSKGIRRDNFLRLESNVRGLVENLPNFSIDCGKSCYAFMLHSAPWDGYTTVVFAWDAGSTFRGRDITPEDCAAFAGSASSELQEILASAERVYDYEHDCRGDVTHGHEFIIRITPISRAVTA